jgi:hypothetical protein
VGSPLAKHVPVDNTKIKVRNPLAKHVPVVLTALSVPQVVHILLVLLELMPVAQHRVIHVVLGNTMVNKDNQVVHHAVLANTMVNKDKLPKLVANHVVLGNTMINKVNLVATTIAMLVPTLNSIKPHV